MALIKWNRKDTLNIREEINRLFDEFMSRTDTESLFGGNWHPHIDVIEQDEEFVVNAELPGLNKDNIKITITSNVLTISGEKKQIEEIKEGSYSRIERRYGTFSRTFTLPTEVEQNKIKATFKDGILTINIPKSEKAKPKEINVTVE